MEIKTIYGILFERNLIDTSIYHFKPKYIIEGEIEDNMFIDKMGTDYYLINDTSHLTVDNNDSVGFIISEEDLLDKYPDSDIYEAQSQYFDEICDNVHIGFCIDNEDRIVLWNINLQEMVFKIANNEIECENDMLKMNNLESIHTVSNVSLNNQIETYGGDDIIAISNDEFKKLLSINDSKKLKENLERIYKDTQDINSHFLNTETYEEMFHIRFEKANNITKEGIVNFFQQSHKLLEEYETLEEIKDFLKYLIDTYINLCMKFEELKKGDFDIEPSKDYLHSLIDTYDSINKKQTLEEAKKQLDIIKQKEEKYICIVATTYEKLKEYGINYQNNLDKQKFSVKEIKKYLDDRVIGQEEAKKDIISAVFMNTLSDEKQSKNSCLLIGPTGSGKTLIVSVLGEYLDKPIEIVDSTQVTVAGYVGSSIEDSLAKLLTKANGDLKKAEEGIIVFDEIDKKGSKNNSDVAGKGVLNSLLSFLQGTTYDVNYNGKNIVFDTSKLTTFATGAFTDILKNRETSIYTENKIGFNPTQNVEENEDIKYPKITIEDLEKYGNIPIELLGRITTITQLSGHTKETLKKILLESKISPLLIEKQKLEKIGISLRWTEGYIEEVVDKAYNLKTGARSLRTTIEESIKEVRWEAIENIDNYKAIILKRESVLDNLECELIDKDGNTINLKQMQSKIKIKEK